MKHSAAARITCFLLAFLLALALTAGNVLLQLWRVTADREMYLNVNRSLMAERMDIVHRAVADAGSANHFSPSALDGIVTEDALREQDAAMFDWFLGQLNGSSTGDAPIWTSSAMEEAIRNDPDFQEAVPSTMRKMVARDQAGYAVSAAISRAVLPIRTNVLRMGVNYVRGKINLGRLVSLIPAAALICLGAGVVLALLMMLMMRRRVTDAFPYIGSGLIASVLNMIALSVIVVMLRLPARCARVSALFSHQVAALEGQLALSAGLYALICLVLGIILMLVFQHTKPARRRRA